MVVYADGPNGALPDPAQVQAIAALGQPEVLLGWVIRQPSWLDTYQGPIRTWMAGYGLRDGVRSGRVRAVPTRLSSVPGLLAGRQRPALAVVGARRSGRNGFRLVGGAGWAPAAAAAAAGVVVEVWPEGAGIEGPPVPGHIVEVVARSDGPDEAPRHNHDAIDRRIGELASSLIPEGATLQWGPGALCAAVIDALILPVRVLTGLATDELAGLQRRGLLIGQAEAAYAWGGPALQTLAAAGHLRLAPVTETHDPSRLAGIAGLVACNTALQVGLDGAVNVEAVGGRVVAGPGGHADFAEAATRAVDGRSVIVCRSTHNGRSSIVAVPDVVTTSRSDVGFVVTEHGIADLRDVDPARRAQRLVAVAAPEHRAALLAANSAADAV